MTLQFTPIVLLYFASSVITVFLAYRTWKMRPSRGATFWAFVMLFSSIYAMGTGLEIIIADPEWKFAMIPLIYFGVTGIMFFWGLFCISYSHYQKWLNNYSIGLLLLIPLTTFILTLFAGQHQLIYQGYEFVKHDGLVMSQVVAYGSFFWVWVAYTYIILLVGSIILIQSARRFPKLFRGQASMVVLSVIIPAIASMLYIFGFNPIDPFDLTPLALTLSGIVMLIGMKRYRFLDIAPVAHDLIFNNVESAVLIIDLKGRIVNINRAAEVVFKCSRNEVIGVHTYDAFPEHLEVQKRFRDVIEIKTEITMDENVYELKITPLMNRRGKLAGRIIMLYNMTERIQVEQKEIELAVERERVEILQQFINNVSHDLKTPLTVMKTSHFLLRHELGDAATTRLDTLEDQTNRLIKLVDDMVMMMRLDEHHESNFRALDIHTLIEEAISQQAKPDGSPLEFFPVAESIIIQADESEIKQVLSNLISNAIRNTADDGTISISTSCKGDFLQIAIKDTGRGIPEADLSKIFERFYRVDKARSSSNGSSGLGLAIVKRIIENHSGKIEVSSTVGEGSEFRILLPILERLDSELGEVNFLPCLET